MINFLSNYENDPEYRKFTINLENFNLSSEFDTIDDAKIMNADSTIAKILESVGAKIYQVKQVENSVELRFVLHNSASSVESLQNTIRLIQPNTHDLSNTTVLEN